VLEPDPGAVRKGERRHPDFRFVVGRGEQIPFPDGSFDRVVAIRSTHHMETPGRLFGEAYRVLSEGGSLVIEELPPTSGWARLFRAMAGHSHHGMTFQGPAAWESALRTAGFDRVEVRPQPPWFFVTGSKPASIRPGAPA